MSTTPLQPQEEAISESTASIYYNDENSVAPEDQHGDETRAMMSIPFNTEEPNENYMKGAGIAVQAFKRNWRNDAISDAFTAYMKQTVLKVSIVLYILLIVLGIIAFPIVVTLLFLSPGTLWQIAVLVPLWALNISQKIRPLQQNRLFIEGLRPLDENMAELFNERMEQNTHLQKRSWFRAFIENIQESSSFLLYSTLLLLCSLIPVVGSIVAAIGETYLVAKSLSWRLMEVYMVGIQQMSFEQRKAFMARHQKILLGFSVPFTSLCAVPIVGPMFLGYAQASMADLFYQEIQHKEFGIANELSDV
jgi:hypothetical protein